MGRRKQCGLHRVLQMMGLVLSGLLTSVVYAQESAMGVCVNAQTEESKYLTAVKGMCQVIVNRVLSPISKYPFVYCFTQAFRDERRYLKTLHGYTYSIIHKRRKELQEKQSMLAKNGSSNGVKSNEVNSDEDSYGQRKRMVFLDQLLQASIDGQPLTDEEIREEVDTFMFEGHDTVTSAISFAIHCLAKHPEYQAKVLEEQRTIFGVNRRRRVTYKDLQDMRYLEMFIKETLRLYPSVPTYFRMISERIQFENITLEPGITLMVFVFGLHRNPDYFSDPLVFDPERFSASNNLGKFPYSYVPFSAGPRNCIDPNYYYTGPQARFLPSNYQQSQHDYLQQSQDQTYRLPQQQSQPGFQQLESYFPTHRDLQTSDLPVHLQQTLPQYRFNSGTASVPKGTAGSYQHVQHFPGTGAHPAPFRPQHNLVPSVTPSTHRPNYSHLFNKDHAADTETFLGQITIQSPAELPPEFNNSPFKPSLDFPNTRNKIDKRPVSQNLDDSNKNTISLGGGSNFLNQRTRIFAPTQDSASDFKNKPQVKAYFVSVNGDVYSTGKAARSTTPYPITTLIRKDRYNPLLYKPTTDTPASFENISRKRKITTPHTFDLESLLEEPIDESKRDKQSDHVEVIKSSVTVPPDHFYTIAPTNESESVSQQEEVEEEYIEEDDDTETPEYDYDSTEDVTEATGTSDRLLNELELHENENNVSDISDNSLRSPKDQDKGYDVLTMKPSTMVKDDNFKEFIDSTVIDNTSSEESVTTTNIKDTSSEANHIEPKVSVVTTKSVINSTIIGTVTPAPKIIPQHESTSPVTTIDEASESWVVVASVQTSRSVSGARYLPSSIVEQDQRTKLLLNEQSEENTEDSTTVESITALPDPLPASGKTKTSTESLIDKLDRVQSDLSSGLLSGGFKPSGNNIAVLTENNMQEKGETTVIDMEMTTPSVVPTTTTPRVVGPPVVIKKFMPNSRPTYKPKFQTRPKSTVQPSADEHDIPQADAPIKANNETLKKPVIAPDIRKFLPAGYTPPPNLRETQPKTIADILNVKTTPKPQPIKSIEDLIDKVKIDDISSLLPPGYKPPETTTAVQEIDETTIVSTTTTTSKKPTVKIDKKDDISAFLPPGYKFEETTTVESTTNPPKVANKTTEAPKVKQNIFKDIKEDDITAFLPPGFKSFKKTITTTTTTTEKSIANATIETVMVNKTKSKLDTLLSAAEPVDISKFLPPGYKPRSTTTKKPATTETVISSSPKEEILNTSTEITITSTKASFKVVFPSRPGGTVRKSSTGRLTTPKYSDEAPVNDKPSASATSPTIHKGWPSRATTEFTGWPTPSTTPISIEKLLEKAREAAAAAAAASSSTEESSSAITTVSTTTSTTSTTTQQPTTPGLCRGECDMAGTIKLVGGAKWVPELLDRNTKEWQILANEVQSQLEDVYSKSSVLNKWYKRIRIDGFSEGSVLVDYLVELNDLGSQVDTLTIKKLFHDSLVEESRAAEPVSSREPKASDLGEEIDEAELNTTIQTDGPRLGLGNFIVDPTYTDFIVIPKQLQPTIGYADENVLLPQWAIAVIVIGLASLLFVIIFGVTVLVNRQKSAKKKQPTPLTEDMLQELNKNHMNGIDNYGADDLYNMEDVWNDRHPYDTKIPKKRSTGSIHGDNSMANLYDSWKSEWNGYYYNSYYGQPHQQPGGSSTHSGHAYGHHQYNGRRRSDYDTNF